MGHLILVATFEVIKLVAIRKFEVTVPISNFQPTVIKLDNV